LAIDVEATYRRYAPMVLRRCRRLLGLEAEAVDAMQDVFVQLMRHRERLDAAALSSLLYRMATNVCLNRLRRRRRRPEDLGVDALVLALAEAPDPDERRDARGLLTRLFAGEQESSRTIAVLHLVDGLTLDEVASLVGMSVSGVRKRLRALRAHVAELEGV
jgi:RNA polymerase sigma-70 factor (ECF subfamily)